MKNDKVSPIIMSKLVVGMSSDVQWEKFGRDDPYWAVLTSLGESNVNFEKKGDGEVFSSEF